MNILKKNETIANAPFDLILPLGGHIKSVIPGPGHDHWFFGLDAWTTIGLGRVNPDLTLAPQFGHIPGEAHFRDSFNPGAIGFEAIHHMMMADNKLWVFGLYFDFGDFSDHIAIARYHLNGLIDDTFAHHGRLIVDLPNQRKAPVSRSGVIHTATHLPAAPPSLLPDGSMVFFFLQITADDLDGRAILVRLTPQGDLDPSFNGTGIAPVHYYGRDLTPKGLLAQGDKTLAFGTTQSRGNETSLAVIARYNRNGTVDQSFNGTGFIAIGDDDRYITTIGSFAYDDQDRIIVSGTFEEPGEPTASPRLFVARLLADGYADPTFNEGAALSVELPFPVCTVNATVLQPQGQGHTILVAATADIDDQPRGALIRLTHEGELDGGFGDGSGYHIADRRSEYLAIDLTSYPGIVVGGYVNDEFDGFPDEYPWLRHFSVDGLPARAAQSHQRVIGIK
ncbi:hypothetical protein [Pseudomonas sp. RIT-To-2]|uniref:hypothetical protein n=1 Tax=Pseudomonas sp. RIT-To-2 TaxID=3462541 RepID=UPI00241303AF